MSKLPLLIPKVEIFQQLNLFQHFFQNQLGCMFYKQNLKKNHIIQTCAMCTSFFDYDNRLF